MQAIAKRSGQSGHTRSIACKNRPKRKAAKRAQDFTFLAPKLGVASPASLILPSLSGVPIQVVRRVSAEATNRIALSFLDLGMARSEDAEHATSASFIEATFKRWIADKTPQLQNVHPQFVLTDSLGAFNEQEQETGQPHLYVGISFEEQNAECFSLKDRIEALEAAVPGLGETAMHKLNSVIFKVMLPINPSFVFDLVSRFYWYYCSDEKAALAEYIECYGDEEEYEAPITLVDFETQYPKLSYSPSEKISNAKIKKLLEGSSAEVAKIAKLLLSAPDMDTWGKENLPVYLEEICSESECVGYGAVIQWGGSEADSGIMQQVCDDWLNYAYQGGCTDLFAVYQSTQDRDGVEKLFKNLDAYIAALTWVDQALSLLTDKI